MEAICTSETSVDTQRTTRRYIPEVGTLLKFVLFAIVSITHSCNYFICNNGIVVMVVIVVVATASLWEEFINYSDIDFFVKFFEYNLKEMFHT
jgi:hypothetical protein